MPDQQYEPTTDDILRCYMQRGGSEEEFNRWYEAEMAAAEQRGAIKALRDAADDSLGRAGHPYKWMMDRADQMEGDDDTH